jgi:hypothetical protein
MFRPETRIMTSEEVSSAPLGQGPIVILLCLSLQLAGLGPSSAQPSTGCPWSGPSVASLLGRHPPPGQIAGTLGVAIVPFLQRGGIPVCFVSTRSGDDRRLRLVLGPGDTMLDVLKEIVRQAPQYQFRGIDGRLVIYPQGEIYDVPVDLGPRQSMTRAAGYFMVLRGLGRKIKELERLRAGLRNEGAGWGKQSYGDTIEVGGSRPIIEHLVSLVQQRPSKAFNLVGDGQWLHYGFVELHLLTSLELHMPSSVKVGETFQVEVAGKLIDGTVVSLVGLECWVAYATSDPEALEIDDSGRAVARKKGIWTVYANYQYVPDVHADVRVE